MIVSVESSNNVIRQVSPKSKLRKWPYSYAMMIDQKNILNNVVPCTAQPWILIIEVGVKEFIISSKVEISLYL